MKKSFTLKSVLLIIMMMTLFSSCDTVSAESTVLPLTRDESTSSLNHIIHPDSEVRGVWIASVYNIDFPSAPNLTEEQLKAEIDEILGVCEKNKLNTVFFQVRPASDALYESEIFPVSSYLNTSGKLTLDPLRYILEEGHKRNIRVYAWVNPLRAAMSADRDKMNKESPAYLHPEWTVEYGEGKLYYNPAIPEVRELISSGVREIVKKYDVDGVVFDDYFYPYPIYGDDGKQVEFDDREEFEKYGAGFDSVADWRRENVNLMVKESYEAVHSTDAECAFGISPFAIWQNDDGKNGGSATKNLEAYHALYCDALAWVKGGYVDFLSPQIYWKFDGDVSEYDVVTRWWNSQLDSTGVKLYVSHASYKYEDGNWENPAGELTEQIEFARSEKSYYGSIFYGYDELKKNTNSASDDVIRAFRDEIIYTNINSTGLGVRVSSPAANSSTTDEYTYIVGMSDPYYPLLFEGKPVSVTRSGYFNLYVKLDEGVNTFTFEQNGVKYEYKITREKGSGGTTAESKPTVLDRVTLTNPYPSTEFASSEGVMWVSCIAPYGSYVTAKFGDSVTELKLVYDPPVKWTSHGYIGAMYGADIALPTVGDGEVVDCGSVLLSAHHSGVTATAYTANIRVIGKGGGIPVRVKEDYTHLKITETSSYYNDYTVQSAGMTDIAVSLRDGFYKLRMGGFISSGDVEELKSPISSELFKISSAEVKNTGTTTDIIFKTSASPAYNGAVEDGKFVLTLYSIDSASSPEAVIGDNPLFTSSEVIRLDGKVRYAFTLVDTANFYGFDMVYSDGAATLQLRNPTKLDLNSEKPLSGVNIVLDAGHGGYDNGAAGAHFGEYTMNEKDINLALTKEVQSRLVSLGANVTLTRADDTALDLYARMDMLEELEPDLCISLHQNSMNYNVDVTGIRGTLALWCMDSGFLLAESVGRSVADNMGRKYLGASYQMLAMCRNPKFPAALIEVGFMPSVEEYEAMLSPLGMKKAADGVANGVLDYFKAQAGYSK